MVVSNKEIISGAWGIPGDRMYSRTEALVNSQYLEWDRGDCSIMSVDRVEKTEQRRQRLAVGDLCGEQNL